jgi:hypothetical protein
MRYVVGIMFVVFALAGAGPVLGSATSFNLNGVKTFFVEGVQANQAVANFTDPVAPKDSSYKATIDWGDGTVEDGTLVSTGKQNANDVTGKHAYKEEGTYELHVTVVGGTASGSGEESSPIAQVSDAPLTAKVSVPSVVEGVALNAPIATFTDLDPNDDVGDYAVTVDWGDGTSSAVKPSKTGPGAFSISGNHTYPDEGPRTIGVTVKDAGGSTISANQAFTVGDAPLSAGTALTRRGTEGRLMPAGAVATFRDANAAATAADYSAPTINWGDRTTSAGTIGPAAGGGWQVAGSHRYREEGRYTITAVVTDRGGSTVTLHGTALIGDAPLHAYGMRFAATVRKSFHGVLATFTDAKFGSAGTTRHPDDYTITVNWGDGHSSAGTLSIVHVAGHSRFGVTGTHTYLGSGLQHVTVAIHDRGGAAATAHSTAMVAA